MSSSSEDVDELDRDVPNRVRAFDAAVELALEKASETSRWSRRFKTSDVDLRARGEIPARTLRRGINDAEALGWVESKRQQWLPGDRAEDLAGDQDDDQDDGEDPDVWWCSFCQFIVLGYGDRPEKCPECAEPGLVTRNSVRADD